MKLKICSKCGKSKPLTEFYKNPYNKDGLAYYCKVCRRKIYLEKKEKKERNINKSINRKYLSKVIIKRYEN